MLKLSGKSVYKGIALGSVIVLKKRNQQVKRKNYRYGCRDVQACKSGRNVCGTVTGTI